jgi:hypothetical protein
MRAVSCAALLVLATGCGDPLKEVYLVSEPRLLGARVEVEGAPERASPAPGENVVVRWLVAAPEPDLELGWALFACEAAPPGAGLPTCADSALASLTSDPVTDAPEFTFQVPPDTMATTLLVYGAFCPGSTAEADADAPACTDGEGTRVSLDFSLEGDSSNQNPTLDPQSVSFDADAWPSGADCDSTPRVAPGTRHTLELVLNEADREPLVQATDLDPHRETLQISHFATGGELERAFSVVAPENERAVVRVAWRAPNTASAEERLVRFFLIVRDLRGGSDWIERAVCIAP